MRRIFGLIAAFLAAWMLGSAASAQAGDPGIAEAAAARDAYWRVVDAGDYVAAYALLTPGMRMLASQERFTRDNQWSAEQMGRNAERRIMRTTVYHNPPSAPEPGLYIAFDFVGRFERADRNCGYIILFQAAGGGPFFVTRTDQTFLANEQANTADADQIWTQMASSFCPGWQPSWTIEPPV